MPASIKQTTPETADFSGWLLHFTRKFNLAIQSRFPGSRINVLFPLLIHMYNGFWKIAPLLQWPDRSGLSPDSLFWLLRGKQPALHMFNMELYWCYLTTSLYKCQGIPNKIPPLFKFTQNYLARYFDIFYRLTGMYRNEKAVYSKMDKQLRTPLNDLVPYEKL